MSPSARVTLYVTWGGKPRASVKLLLLLHDHVESVGVGWHSIGLGEISHPGAINDNQGGHGEAARAVGAFDSRRGFPGESPVWKAPESAR